MESKPNYYAILPAEVRYDNSLTDSEKLLYSEITSLSNQNGYCWASNQYFADLYDVTKKTISRRISNLVKKDYLERKLIKDESKKIKKRKLTPLNNKKYSYGQSRGEGGDRNVQESITRTNNINKNKDREEENAPYKKIKELYNEICTSLPSIRKMSERRRKHVGARWKEEKDIEVFREVFEKAENSSFLTGNNNRNWTADFDWIVKNDTNFNKILEGKYDNKRTNTNNKKLESTTNYEELEELYG